MRNNRLKNTVTVDELAADIFNSQIQGEPDVDNWDKQDYAAACLCYMRVSHLPEPWLSELIDAIHKLQGISYTTTLTPALIAKGECGIPNRCALALGLAEMFDVSPDRVVVDGVGAAVLNPHGYEAVSMALSDRLQAWVLAFDADKQVESVDILAKSSVDGIADYLLDLV